MRFERAMKKAGPAWIAGQQLVLEEMAAKSGLYHLADEYTNHATASARLMALSLFGPDHGDLAREREARARQRHDALPPPQPVAFALIGAALREAIVAVNANRHVVSAVCVAATGGLLLPIATVRGWAVLALVTVVVILNARVFAAGVTALLSALRLTVQTSARRAVRGAARLRLWLAERATYAEGRRGSLRKQWVTACLSVVLPRYRHEQQLASHAADLV